MDEASSEILGEGGELSSKHRVLKKAEKASRTGKLKKKPNQKNKQAEEKQQGENNISYFSVWLRRVAEKKRFAKTGIPLYSHPEFVCLMIIGFCILPASLSGAGKTAEKCSGQSSNNKNPRALCDFPSIVSDSLGEVNKAQTDPR